MTSLDSLTRADVDGAGPVWHTPHIDTEPFGRVVIFLGGLGTTAEQLAKNGRKRGFQDAGYALIFADHYNEGARRDKVAEPVSNRSGWTKCQKNLFWRAIHRTAQDVPRLVDFALATYGANVKVVAYGASMGGDIFLTSLQHEARLTAIVLERATPNWLRPDSIENVLGECAAGDAIYEDHSPCNQIETYVAHPTAIFFICGESDQHVPRQSAAAFVATLRERRTDQGDRDLEHHRLQLLVMPSGGWCGHILNDAPAATRHALEFLDLAISATTAASAPPTLVPVDVTGAEAPHAMKGAAAAAAMPRTLAALQQSVSEGTCLGIQLACSHSGVSYALSVGDRARGLDMDDGTMVNWQSTAKPVAAVAIALLIDRGTCDLHAPVARYVPEFESHGKGGVTVAQLLTHTAGIPFCDLHLLGGSATPPEWREFIETICDSKLEWTPGTQAGYHPTSSWFILGEIVRRVDGRSFNRFVREAIFEPLGMVDCYIGMTAGEYEACADRIGGLWNSAGGTQGIGADPLSSEDGLREPAWVRACIPGGNLRGPACQVLRLFEMLLRDGVGPDGHTALLTPSTARLLVRRHRTGMNDFVQGFVCDWGLGVFVGAEKLIGAHASSDAFGHGGAQSSVGWADPKHGIAVAVAANGKPGPNQNTARMNRIATCVYEDLVILA